ncbi:FAD:protein FMN transferase [Fodinibius sediminis]|uniref:FAD:protein FMN transferase n=1 Tax=Fodinibius sediminis TaxID=1214077 RepID=A0A521F2R0_9BACT|nr:FAD:protein FMN transferase [Fodinibius sediminis]SMO90397.1 thiamine biosynthesis lipoprotein [Fodinibius sediminis]
MIFKSRSYFLFLILCLLLPIQNILAQDLKRYEFTDQQMGTLFKITFYADDDSLAEAASRNAFQRADTLNSILSDYEPDSNLNYLSARSGTDRFFPVDPVLFRVISKAQLVARQTEGAFDITTGPLVKLWRSIRHSKNPELPPSAKLQALKQRVGYRYVEVDSSRTAVALTHPRMQLDLGGIAKGYAADEILRVLNQSGIQSALVDAGGDIRLGAPPPGKKGWTVRIPAHNEKGEPEAVTLLLANSAVATSGDLFQHVNINGKRYSHIIDPHTGLGLTNQSMVTIIAPNGITADSYASAVSVMGAEGGRAFIESRPQCAMRIEYSSKRGNSEIMVVKTNDFDALTLNP